MRACGANLCGLRSKVSVTFDIKVVLYLEKLSLKVRTNFQVGESA